MLDLQINVGSIVAKSGFVSTNKVPYQTDNLIISLLKIMSLLYVIIIGLFNVILKIMSIKYFG